MPIKLSEELAREFCSHTPRINPESGVVFYQRLEKAMADAITKGRVSVLQDFDNMCCVDAFIGFTDEEWKAVKKFFAFNKKISGWDK